MSSRVYVCVCQQEAIFLPIPRSLIEVAGVGSVHEVMLQRSKNNKVAHPCNSITRSLIIKLKYSSSAN